MKFLAGALVAGGVIGLITKVTAAGRLQFYVEKVRRVTFEGATPILTIGLGVQNTSSQKMVIRSLAASISCNNIEIGNVGSFATTIVAPNTQGVLLLDFRLSILGIVNDLLKAIQYGNFSQTIQLKGYANVDNYQVPIDLNYKVGAA